MRKLEVTRKTFKAPTSNNWMVDFAHRFDGTGAAVFKHLRSTNDDLLAILANLNANQPIEHNLIPVLFNQVCGKKLKCGIILTRSNFITKPHAVDINNSRTGWRCETRLYMRRRGIFLVIFNLQLSVNLDYISETIVAAWNLELEKVCSVHADTSTAIMRRLLNVTTRHKEHRKNLVGLVTARRRNALHLKAITTEVERYKAQQLVDKQKKSIEIGKQVDLGRALGKAKNIGLITDYSMVGGSVQIILAEREVVLPQVSYIQHGSALYEYPGGTYLFPQALITVPARGGGSCVINDVDGGEYPHPHANYHGVNSPPCWTESPSFGVGQTGQFNNIYDDVGVKQMLDYLWFADPVAYCRYLHSYLCDMWDVTGDYRYHRLNHYGKVFEVTTPVPTHSQVQVEGEAAIYPIPECLCKAEKCVCTCRVCEEYRVTRRCTAEWDEWRANRAVEGDNIEIPELDDDMEQPNDSPF